MQNDMRDRLIELIREAHTKWCNSTHDFEHTCADHLIANDVVPVVRCKDCTEWNKDECECSHWYGFRENDFCSYGERKEENE